MAGRPKRSRSKLYRGSVSWDIMLKEYGKTPMHLLAAKLGVTITALYKAAERAKLTKQEPQWQDREDVLLLENCEKSCHEIGNILRAEGFDRTDKAISTRRKRVMRAFWGTIVR